MPCQSRIRILYHGAWVSAKPFSFAHSKYERLFISFSQQYTPCDRTAPVSKALSAYIKVHDLCSTVTLGPTPTASAAHAVPLTAFLFQARELIRPRTSLHFITAPRLHRSPNACWHGAALLRLFFPYATISETFAPRASLPGILTLLSSTARGVDGARGRCEAMLHRHDLKGH